MAKEIEDYLLTVHKEKMLDPEPGHPVGSAARPTTVGDQLKGGQDKSCSPFDIGWTQSADLLG